MKHENQRLLLCKSRPGEGHGQPATRRTFERPKPQRWEAQRPSHAHTAAHARTHERNEYDFPVGLTPQPPIYIDMYPLMYVSHQCLWRLPRCSLGLSFGVLVCWFADCLVVCLACLLRCWLLDADRPKAIGYAARCACTVVRGVFRTSSLDLDRCLDSPNSQASGELPPSATVLSPSCPSVLLGHLGFILGICWLILAFLTCISGHLGSTCLYLPPTLSQLWSKLAQLGSTWPQFCPTWPNLGLRSVIFESFWASCWAPQINKKVRFIRKVRQCDFLTLAEATIKKIVFRRG